MSYFNHKWKSFLNESKKEGDTKKHLTEDKSMVKQEKESKVLYYPKFSVTDDFGKRGTPARAMAELFFKQVSRKRDLRSIIQGINDFIKADPATVAGMSVKKCLGALTMLDTLSTIVYKFDPSSAGYLLEPFMAAVYGGKGKQVKTKEGGIEDIYDYGGEKVSLKLLKGGYTKGSLSDLRRTIKDMNAGRPITYVLVEKVGDGENVKELIFYQFTVGTDGREWHWVSETGRKMFKGKKGVEGTEEVIDFIPASPPAKATFIADEFTSRANPGKAKVPVDRSAYKYAQPGEGAPLQKGEVSFAGGKAPEFKIGWSDAREGTEIGRIDFGGENWVQSVAQKYVNVLEAGISDIYENLDTLNNSINTYLVKGDDAAAAKAQRAASELSNNTECVVKKVNCKVRTKK